MKRILLFFLLSSIYLTTYSQAGSLDNTFGYKGMVRVDLGRADYTANWCSDIVSGSDGSIYIVIGISGFETIISHRLQDGSVDTHYGKNGYSVPVYLTPGTAILQPDGKIVVGGHSSKNSEVFVLARFNSNGSLDESFGNQGKQVTDFSVNDDYITSMQLQKDGKILAAGYSKNLANENIEIAIARYNTDGTPDMSFSDDGRQTINFGSTQCMLTDMAVEEDGTIMIAAYAYERIDPPGSSEMAVARLLPDGNPDLSFNGTGEKMMSLNTAYGWTGATKIKLLGQGKMLFAGISNTGLQIVQLFNDGEFDSSFSEDGIQISPFGVLPFWLPADLRISGEKLIVGGFRESNPRYDTTIVVTARYSFDGSLDKSFSQDGFDMQTLFTDFVYVPGLTLRTTGNGKIFASSSTERYFAILRYNADGTLDTGFDKDGRLTDAKAYGETAFNTSAIQADGKIIAAGQTTIGSKQLMVVARFNKDGNVDSSFSEDGKQLIEFGEGSSTARDVSIQANGKILIAGNYTRDFAMARLNTNGSLDSSFASGGRLLTDMDSYYAVASALSIQPDGKIIVGGYIANPLGNKQFVIVRYNTDGSLDNSFSANGKLVDDLASTNAYVNDILLQPDGKILAIGSAGNTQDVAIARYQPDGSPDLTFGKEGKLITDFSGTQHYDFGTTAALQQDGKIIIGGSVHAGPTGSNMLVVSVMKNGSIDSSFAVNGKFSISLAASNELVTSVLIQPDQKIVVATSISGGSQGNALHYNPGDIGLIRLYADGKLDEQFANKGILVQDIAGEDRIESINMSANRIYAVGRTTYVGIAGLIAAYQVGDLNQPPVAGAWFQKYYNPTTALLAAWDSKDPEGGPITYWWEKTAGPAGSGILYANSASPVVTGLVDGTYTYRLTVTDNQGATGTALVSFTVSTNLPPIAGAWFQKYYSPTSALLAAWGSYDPEGGPIKYFWEKVDGPGGTTLLYGNSASPVVNGLTNGVYTYRLTVTDDHGATGMKELTFAVNNPPLVGNKARQPLPEATSNKAGRFIIYPNPVSDVITFNWNSDYIGDAMLTIVDISGRKVLSMQIQKSGEGYYGNIAVNQLKAGQYYLYLTNGKEKIMNVSFVKK